jgi:hypothetical protein
MTNVFSRLLAVSPNIKKLAVDIGIDRNRLYLLASGKGGVRASDWEIAKAHQATYLQQRYDRDMKYRADIATEDLELYRRELGL